MLQNKNQVSKGEIQLWLKVKPDFSFIPSMENAFIENYTWNLSPSKNTPSLTYMIHVLYSLYLYLYTISYLMYNKPSFDLYPLEEKLLPSPILAI